MAEHRAFTAATGDRYPVGVPNELTAFACRRCRPHSVAAVYRSRALNDQLMRRAVEGECIMRCWIMQIGTANRLRP